MLDINDHGEVYIACKPFSSKWRKLGARLGVLETTLATIEDDHRLEGVERCMSAMISVWLRRPQPEGEVTDEAIPTWRNLCVALSLIDRGLAEGIAVEHDSNYISPTGENSVILAITVLNRVALILDLLGDIPITDSNWPIYVPLFLSTISTICRLRYSI